MKKYHNPAEMLTAISLLDGRAKDKVGVVSEYFSEFALIRYRIRIEVSYLIFLCENTKIVRTLRSSEKELLNKIWTDFNVEDAEAVKEHEAKINHDVKAVEYFLRKKMDSTTLADITTFIHFGLTSYDINTPAYGLMLADYRREVINPHLDKLLKSLKNLISDTKNMPMLARTHGQPALPTTMGKELAVYYQRMKKEEKMIAAHEFEAKLTGAVGNFNALAFVCGQYDWINLSQKFIRKLGLVPNTITTQIMPYDNWLAFFDSIKRLNYILLGLCQDIWWYISMEYFGQVKKAREVGSSTMSHKINPITFENAEGNLQLANSLFEFFSRKLAVSRLQRDLSDSTIKRDFGLAFGFTYLSWDSLLSGMSRIRADKNKMSADLDSHWEVFSEGIQTYLRVKGKINAFELLKDKTRGRTFNKKEIYQLIDTLAISAEDKKKLKIKDLSDYSGLAEKITESAISI